MTARRLDKASAKHHRQFHEADKYNTNLSWPPPALLTGVIGLSGNFSSALNEKELQHEDNTVTSVNQCCGASSEKWGAY